MNQGIESRQDDGLVYTTTNLGPAIGMSDFTVVRWMSQEPDRLPPPILLSKPGSHKQKRVWLKTTVAQWMLERQEHGQPLQAPPMQVQGKAQVAASSRRGPGRPRKLTMTAGGATSMSSTIEQHLRAVLLQHLSTPGEKIVKGAVLGNLVISPFEKTIEWVPAKTALLKPSPSAPCGEDEEGGVA